jgi:tetratricopeptide (TPR) repeat protein
MDGYSNYRWDVGRSAVEHKIQSIRKGGAVKKVIAVFSVLALIATIGCASGGKQEPATGGDAESATAGNKKGGFEKNYGPAEINYQSAVQFLAAGNYDEAISHLKTATMLKPTYLEAWSELGNTLMKIKDFQGGIGAYEKALELSPGNTGYISSIAYGYLYLENWDKSEEYYTRLIEKDSLSYEGHVHLGFISQKKNDLDRAIYHYERALAAQPNDATTIGTLASIYEKKGDEEKKIEYLRLAVVAAPDIYKFKTQLGSAYIKRKDYENAVPIFEDLIKSYPDEAAYHKNLGLVLSQMNGRLAEAPAELEKSLELGGDDPYVSGILALVYNQLKKYDKAIAAAKKGIEAKAGQEPLLYYQWGAALSKLESYDDAIVMFQKVVATKDPQWSDAANKEIVRQEKLKKIAEQKKQQQQ